VADAIAKEGGILCVVPDHLEGRPIPTEAMKFLTHNVPSQSFLSRMFESIITGATLVYYGIPFILRHRQGPTLKLIDATIQDLKSDRWGISHFGAVGYCWGGKYVVLLGGQDPPPIECLVTVHPSRLTIADVKATNVPCLFLAAEIDPQFGQKQLEESKRVLEEKLGDRAQFKLYPKVVHGFGMRGDNTDDTIREAAKDATQKTIQFFVETLGKD
jgi:dienelactone hydrolase